MPQCINALTHVKNNTLAVIVHKFDHIDQYNLNPSAWEYQSAALGYNYHTARQSGALLLYDNISYHPVVEPLSLFRDIIITANGIVYQWNKEPNKEILIQNTPIQHLKLPKSYKKNC